MVNTSPQGYGRPSHGAATTTTTTATPHPLTYEDILDTVGRIDCASAAAILESGATLEELVEAFAWSTQESDVMGKQRRSLSGRVERVYCILVGDDEFGDPR